MFWGSRIARKRESLGERLSGFYCTVENDDPVDEGTDRVIYIVDCRVRNPNGEIELVEEAISCNVPKYLGYKDRRAFDEDVLKDVEYMLMNKIRGSFPKVPRNATLGYYLNQ